jgi:hypothetical protein
MVCPCYLFFSLITNLISGVVSAPLWNSEKSRFAGMLTVLDIIHLIQYYYRTASYDYAATDVETFRLESLRGAYLSLFSIFVGCIPFQLDRHRTRTGSCSTTTFA